MHVLFVHKEYPGHFGHVAARLARDEGFSCTFVYSRLPARFQNVLPGHASASSPGGMDLVVDGVRLISYPSRGASRETNPCSLHFEISSWHNQAVYQTLKARPEIRPDLVVGHASYATTLYLANLYDCPTIAYCEFFHRSCRQAGSFRPEYPPGEVEVLSRHAFNATNLLSLEAARACYSPTRWQRSQFPLAYQPRIQTLFDGIDRSFWYRRQVARRLGEGRAVPPGTRVVTYCAYGLEPTRGFDIFMRVAKRICDARSDVVFVVVGADRHYYGPAVQQAQGRSFLEYVVSQDHYDLDRFVFAGQVPEDRLVEILSFSDLHVYLTVPFVLSWSLMDALACGCTVLASDTEPVREMIEHERNGLLAGFHDVEGLAEQALRVLDDPEAYRVLGREGTRRIDEAYSLDVTIPQTVDFYRRVARGEETSSGASAESGAAEPRRPASQP